MRFPAPLLPGTLLLREKRFIAQVRLDSDGRTVLAHTNNSGSMRGLCSPGMRVWLSPAPGAGRRLPFTWELVEPRPGVVAGINTQLANRLVREAIERTPAASQPQLVVFPTLFAPSSIRPEAVYGTESSRADFRLEGAGGRPGVTWVEVKNATLVEGDKRALFPDAPTERGRKHLRELARRVRAGDRAALVFVVQRPDADCVAPADAVDPGYGRALRRAARAGVELYALRVDARPEGPDAGLWPVSSLPVSLPALRRSRPSC
jgi:sugar fermentation stimulation protein A